jgi:hypothetical protein
MKIARCIRDLHRQCAERNARLADEVRDVLRPRVEEHHWFFLWRLKELESYALKIETGRVANPSQMDDFYACTIVVPTMVEIEQAELLVNSLYDSIKRKPSTDAMTHKRPSSFVFDDLRLYVSRRSSVSGRNADLTGLVFEVQIKTILQHAWALATHDLIYKSDTISWPLERIAFQVKAMLEHAEVAIAEANRLADASAVSKKDQRTVDTLRLILDLRHIWSLDHLPCDIKRLAETIYEILGASDLAAERYREIINAEKCRCGILPGDSSPYSFTVQALANNADIDFETKFKRRHVRTTLAIHSGMELPDWMMAAHPRILRID